ncbi:hypothetical protein PR048_013149 [Dryococelus australis]|uniref:Uncharacterized protein n=1 Tax=Dryococelus australis TaxID=614101 RepID=A0ABQ9HRC4_9NEOP|nr:hypothetical protein PR048_013149 [Dryococelus australis]
MNRFTFNEMADILHLCYGAANSNTHAARRLYAQFPWRVVPSQMYFSTADCRLRKQGHVVEYEWCHDVRDPLNEPLLERVAEDPGPSTHVVASQLGILHTTIWNVWNKHCYNAYHTTKVQKLHQLHHRWCIEFCEWYNKQWQRVPTFPSIELFTDEATSMKMGYLTLRNTSTGLLKTLMPPTNVAGILGDMTKPNCPDISHYLSELLPYYLKMFLLKHGRTLIGGWSITVHFSGLRGPCMHFFFSGDSKELVYNTPVVSKTDLVACIVTAALVIQTQEGVLSFIHSCMHACMHACMRRWQTGAMRAFEPTGLALNMSCET